MADTYQQGYVRDASGIVVTVFLSDAVAPLTWNNGKLVDFYGAVVITEPGAGGA